LYLIASAVNRLKGPTNSSYKAPVAPVAPTLSKI
jgi:hypothetical protein